MSKPTEDTVLSDTSEGEDASGAPGEGVPERTAPEAMRLTGPEAGAAGMTRRGLLIGLGGCAGLFALGGVSYQGQKSLLRPPGGQDEESLIGSCIRCGRCYEVCPRKVVVPAHIEDGLAGMRTPTLDFSSDYCDFCEEENGGTPLCVLVCPTHALDLPADAKALDVIIGKAVIDTHSCLAYRETGCRTCYDNCPYDAISLDARDGARYPLPVVDRDLCNGCGACEATCISLESGSLTQATEVAIVVRTEGSLEHRTEGSLG